MKKKLLYVISTLLLVWQVTHAQTYPPLGTENNFTVLAGTQVTSTGNTVINGAVGVSPGATLTGFPPGVINGSVHLNNSTAQNAQADLEVAFNDLENQTPTVNLTGQNLGGKTLSPGVYRFTGAAVLDGVLTLDAGGNPDGKFIFQVQTNLTVAGGASMVLKEGARARNIFFQVGNTVTIGAGADFRGSVLAFSSITAEDGAVIKGRLMSIDSFVRFTNVSISTPLPTSLADLEVVKTASPDPHYEGQQLTYTIRVRNLGPSTETDVLVRDVLPPGVAYVSSTATVASYNPATGIWPISSFPNGATHTLTIVVRMTASSFITNTATIAAEGRDENSANNSSTVTVCALPRAPGIIVGPNSVCQTATDNVYSISPMAGIAQYNWTVPDGWSITSGQGTTSITVVSGNQSNSGTIVVTAVNVCGEGLPSSRSVFSTSTLPGALGPITGNTGPCTGSTGNIFSVAAVAGADTYTWTVPAGWAITAGQGTPIITVTAGSLGGTISVTASNGCGSTKTETLAVAPSLAKPDAPLAITGDLNVCSGVVGTVFSVAPVPGATSYTWTVPAGWAITSGQGTTSITVTPGSASGTISVLASNGCGSSTAATLAVSVSTAKPPSPDLITGNSAPCAGTTGNTYSVAPVAGATSYTWTVPTGWVITAGQGTTSITVTAGISNGSISVTTNNACGSSIATTLAVRPSTEVPPALGPITGNTMPCGGTTGNVYSITPVTGASSYAWTVPAGWTITAGQGTTSITVTAGSSGGTISVSASNGCGNSPVSTLAVSPTTGAPIALGPITGNSIPCQNSTGDVYSVAVITAATSYVWTVPVGWTITSGQGTTSVTVTGGTNGGTISVIAFNDCGASAPSTFAVTTAITAPSAIGPITGSTGPCVGSASTTYSVDPVAGAASYTWAVPAGWNITSGQGTTTITVTVAAGAGDVSVTASNGCGTTDPETLAVAPAANQPVKPGPITGSETVCGNKAGYIYSVEPVAGVDYYTWSLPAGWVITAGHGSPSITVTAGENGGTISMNATNGCGDSDKSTLAVTTLAGTPAQPGAILGNSVPCTAGTASATYQINPVAGATTYTWAVPSGWTITAGQGTTTVTVTVGSTAGDVSVAAANDCGTSPATTLGVAPASTSPESLGAITGLSSHCQGQTDATFSVEAISNVVAYTWTVPAGWTITAGQGTTSITVTVGSAAGTVAVVASNGCGESAPVSKEVSSSVAAPGALGTITGNSVPCTTSAAEKYKIDGVSGALSYVWTVPTGWTITSGQGTTEITVQAGAHAGDVSVKALNGCGESPVSSLDVSPATTAPPAPGPISGVNSLCSGQQGVVYSIDPVPNASYYTWTLPDQTWTIISGQGTTAITVNAGLTAGTLVVTASNGCGTGGPSTLSTTFLPAAAPPDEIKDESAPCKGLVYSVTEVNGATSYTWTLPEGWTIVSGQGTFRIQAKALSATATGEISVVANITSCASLPVSLMADASKGESELVLPNVFTPNGDDINDTWVVKNLQKFPDNELVILNRWGSEVYRRRTYQSDWNGNGLSAGTYYYVLRVKECDGVDKTYRGYVMIVK
jgi:large repetitive protein